jgi:hypothetical protein
MEDDQAYADNFYRVIQVGTTMGLSASLLDSMATWGDSMWPNGDWEAATQGETPQRIQRVKPQRTPAKRAPKQKHANQDP